MIKFRTNKLKFEKLFFNTKHKLEEKIPLHKFYIFKIKSTQENLIGALLPDREVVYIPDNTYSLEYLDNIDYFHDLKPSNDNLFFKKKIKHKKMFFCPDYLPRFRNTVYIYKFYGDENYYPGWFIFNDNSKRYNEVRYVTRDEDSKYIYKDVGLAEIEHFYCADIRNKDI